MRCFSGKKSAISLLKDIILQAKQMRKVKFSKNFTRLSGSLTG